MCSSDLRYKQIFRTKFCIRIGIFPFYAEDGTAEIDIIANYAAVEHAIFAGRVEADIVVSAEDANIRPIEGGCFLRSEEHTSELQSLMRISYAVFCLKKTNITNNFITHSNAQNSWLKHKL